MCSFPVLFGYLCLFTDVVFSLFVTVYILETVLGKEKYSPFFLSLLSSFSPSFPLSPARSTLNKGYGDHPGEESRVDRVRAPSSPSSPQVPQKVSTAFCTHPAAKALVTPGHTTRLQMARTSN